MNELRVTIQLLINGNIVRIERRCLIEELDTVLDWADAVAEVNGDKPDEKRKPGRPKKA